MSLTSSISPSLALPYPFEEGKYIGAIKCNMHRNDAAHLISVTGERISLETFTSPYSEDFKNKFVEISNESPENFHRPEFNSLRKIFQNPLNVKKYGDGKIINNVQMIMRLDRDSSRPLNGDVFTGFGVVDNLTGDIIGRAAVGAGGEPGEAQFGLIIREDYQGKKFGKEAALLLATLAVAYFENQYEVGDENFKSPVIRFTATSLNHNEMSRKLLQIGFNPIKTLPSGWFQRFIHFLRLDQLFESIGYPLNMRKLYEIKGDELRPTLSKLMDINKLEVNITDVNL